MALQLRCASCRWPVSLSCGCCSSPQSLCFSPQPFVAGLFASCLAIPSELNSKQLDFSARVWAFVLYFKFPQSNPGPLIESSVAAICNLRRCSTSVRLLLQSSLSLLNGCLDALIVCLTSSTVFGEPADHSMEKSICLCVTASALASWRLA